MDVLESPNSLEGENRLEETVTDGELLDMTNGTEPLAEDSFTTITGDPVNVTEQYLNQSDFVENENMTNSVSENVTIVEPVTERVKFRTNLEHEEPTSSDLRTDLSTNEPTTADIQNATYLSDQNSSAAHFNETGPPIEWLISPHEKDLGQIRNLLSNATVPEPTLDEININSNDSAIPDNLKSAISTVRYSNNTEPSMETQTPHNCSKHEKTLHPEWWYNTNGLEKLENSRKSTMPPATLIQARQLFFLDNIPKVTVPTTSTPITTTKQKISFRSKPLPKKSTAKTTRKPKVRKVVVKNNTKATKKARSAGKVKIVVKGRFRKVLRRRRATTTRLVFRRRRRTTRLVRKTTTALTVVE